MATKKTVATINAGLSAGAVVSSILTEDMFVSSGEIIEHPVKLGDGKEHVMYFKPMTALDWKKHLEAEKSDDATVRQESTVRLISRYLVEPDGRRSLTPQQAARLKPAVSGAIFMAILEVNELFKMPKVAAVDDEDDDDLSLGDDDDDIIDEAADTDDEGEQGN